MSIKSTIINEFMPPLISKAYKSFKKRNNDSTTDSFTYNPKLINSHSQYCEDLLIDSIIKKQNGFYIDIGANDPVSLSNTKRFYDYGWRGINIDANPDCYNKFCNDRPLDINLNVGISNSNSKLNFYELTYSSLSSFSRQAALANAKKFNIKIEKEYEIEVITLEEIFKKYVHDKVVDFISIDTEGLEMEVLNGNNWKLYRPYLILIETGDFHKEIYHFLNSINYLPIFHNGVNSIFVDKNVII